MNREGKEQNSVRDKWNTDDLACMKLKSQEDKREKMKQKQYMKRQWLKEFLKTNEID